MKKSFRITVVGAALAVAALAAATPAQASQRSGGAVFVQTNDPSGNSIATFDRGAGGALAYVASYPTGGDGGRESGAGSDPLATQGSLRLVPGAGLLLAVNAGSDTISVFEVHGDRLHLEQVLSSGGSFPVGFAIHDNLVYVLDAGLAGHVSGYRIAGGMLHPIAGSTRSLGLANSSPPFFLSSPAEVGFAPDGAHLVVTTKTNSTGEGFSVRADGRLSAAPVVTSAAGVPFAFVFENANTMILNFAASSSLEVFGINADGTITPVGAPTGDGQAAACWITPAQGFDYVSNTASGNLSQFQVTGSSVTLVNPVAASGITGAIDAAALGDFVYVQAGVGGTVHVFSIGAGGALTAVQVATVPDGGSQEGIAVT